MDNDTKANLKKAGIDADEAIARFMGNEKLFLKMLRKFADDSNFESLEKAVEKKQPDEAFRSAHSLKGVAGNLSIFNLFDHLTLQVSLFREKREEEAYMMMNTIKEDYLLAIKAIKELPNI